MSEIVKCPVCCYEYADKTVFQEDSAVYYKCPICGNFEMRTTGVVLRKFNRNHLAAYMFYRKKSTRIYTGRSDEECQRLKHLNGMSLLHINENIIENWYPKRFAERIEFILLYLEKHIPHIGQQITLRDQELDSLLFIDRFEDDGTPRDKEECRAEFEYLWRYLRENGYIFCNKLSSCEDDYTYEFSLTPKSYLEIEKMQKTRVYSKKAFIAMQFGEKTEVLRKAIKEGISDAGYIPILIDEVLHNNSITPEIFKQIRDSRFVVVDLTHGNQGAYLEEGYAIGLGKEVIQLCRKGTKLHFDTAQINTIIWSDESEIPKRLCDRILATID